MWSCHRRDSTCPDGRLCTSFLWPRGVEVDVSDEDSGQVSPVETNMSRVGIVVFNNVVFPPCDMLGVSSGQQVALLTSVDVL